MAAAGAVAAAAAGAAWASNRTARLTISHTLCLPRLREDEPSRLAVEVLFRFLRTNPSARRPVLSAPVAAASPAAELPGKAMNMIATARIASSASSAKNGTVDRKSLRRFGFGAISQPASPTECALARHGAEIILGTSPSTRRQLRHPLALHPSKVSDFAPVLNKIASGSGGYFLRTILMVASVSSPHLTVTVSTPWLLGIV